MNIEELLVSQLRLISFDNLPKNIVGRLQTILLHNLAVGMAGRNRKEYKILLEAYSKEKTHDRILLEAVAMSQPALEDFYGANHFGPLMIPNALYHGLVHQANGKALIASLAAGFALGIFLSDELGKALAEKGFRGTPILGTLAAAASAAHIAGSCEQEFRHTLAHASANVFGNGISLLAGTDEWRYQAGMGAYHASFAYMLARNGEVGYTGFLFGEKGMAEIFAESSSSNSVLDLASLEKIGVKRHPVHIFVLSPAEATKQLFLQIGPQSAEGIKRISVRVPAHQISEINLQKGPYENTSQAIVSIYTNVALILLFGTTSDEILKKANNPEVLRLIEKIEVLPDKRLGQYQCDVVLEKFDKTYTVSIENQLNLYFPSFESELTHLVEEAESWGVHPKSVELLAKEIRCLNERDSLSTLIEIYENGLLSRMKG
nr:MmgE/PrpD family protein [Aneurinibacillus terranovensis]